jgi:hypothetical protein
MSVKISVSVPGPFRRFVSPLVAIGLAVAQTTDNVVTIAATMALRIKFTVRFSPHFAYAPI